MLKDILLLSVLLEASGFDEEAGWAFTLFSRSPDACIEWPPATKSHAHSVLWKIRDRVYDKKALAKFAVTLSERVWEEWPDE
jgi:hypothetical protein